MSGGSYNNLYLKDLDELLNQQDLVQQMADDLAKLGYAPDAAKETQEFLLTLRQFENRLETMKSRLEPVWEAYEFYKSGDADETRFKKILEKYRL